MAEDALKTRYRQAAEVEAAVMQAVETGLLVGEEHLIRKHLPVEAAIIDAGSGAGRVGLGCWEIGYRSVVGVDFSREMVAAARNLGRKLEYDVPFRVGDVRKLAFEGGLFDAVMTDVATWQDWDKAACGGAIAQELARVVRPGGWWIGGGRWPEVLGSLPWSCREEVEIDGGSFWLASRE